MVLASSIKIENFIINERGNFLLVQLNIKHRSPNGQGTIQILRNQGKRLGGVDKMIM